jgi:acyl-CoA synthetase (AMP-forming)/AMP-acid ligase II
MHPEYSQPLADYVRFFANLHPARNAYIDGSRECTYAELDKLTNRVANGLVALGCQPGDRVGFVGLNSGEYVEAFFGAMKAKVVNVGVNWRLAEPEFEYILKDSGIKVLICDPDFVPLFETFRDRIETLEHVISTAPEAFAAWRDQFEDSDPSLEHTEDDPVVQFYTSGTTGRPKGVVLTNRAMGEHRQMEDRLGDWFISSERQEIIINAMPNFHVGGLGWILMGMFRGAQVVLLPGPDADKFLDLIEQRKATHLFAVPIVLAMMVEAQKKSPRDVSSLQVFHYGSSAIAPSILKEAIEIMQCGFSGYYGMTENNGVVTNLAPKQHDPNNPERLKSCGKPLPGITIKIADEDGNEVPTGDSGEIWVNSPGMMSGYWNRPDATAEVLVDGWYRSGDGGRVDEEGFLYMTDRIKDMIVSGGENIYPTEIENVLITHTAVAEVAVVGVPDDKWGESVKAVIVPAQGQQTNSEELIQFLRPLLAGYKIPRLYEFVESLPRNSVGKVQKFKLR